MNASAVPRSQSTPTPCDTEIYLDGRLGPISTESYVVLWSIAVVNLIACPFTTVLNSLVIVAVNSKPRLKTNSNLVLGCLATTDWIMGVMGQPLFIASIIIILHGKASEVNCSILILARSLLRILGLASLLHLALVNIERYIAIKHTFKYISLVTRSRILQSSALVWITTLLLTIPLAITDALLYGAVSSYLMLLSMAVILFCQLVLYFETRRHEKQIAVQQVSVESRRKFLEEKKALKVTTIVVLIMLLAFAPIIFVRALLARAVISTVSMSQIAHFSAISMIVLNSVINPLIYCARIRQFRAAFIEIMFRKSIAQADENQ